MFTLILRFGKGYRLSVRCPAPSQAEFLRSLESSLPFAKLEDVHCAQLKFNIPQEEVRLGDIFSVMCAAKTDGLIEDFSVSQTTLDDVSLNWRMLYLMFSISVSLNDILIFVLDFHQVCE